MTKIAVIYWTILVYKLISLCLSELQKRMKIYGEHERKKSYPVDPSIIMLQFGTMVVMDVALCI